MKRFIILFIKGFIMGIANVIPGVSGGTLALIMGIYEDFIESISHFFSNFKKNILFLTPVVLGMGAAIITMSSVISFLFKHIPIATTLFFVGLVIGGIPMLTKKVKGKKDTKVGFNIIAFILTFSLVIFMAVSGFIFDGLKDVDLANLSIIGYIILFIIGIIASGTMIIPGVSGSLVLMLLGYYYPIINTIKDLTHFNHLFNNCVVLGLFGIGILVGVITIAKLFEYLFNKHETLTYYGVLGFIYASIIAIPISAFNGLDLKINVFEIILSIIMVGIGFIVSYKLGDK